MKFSVIIPARYASQRLPGKPLCKIGNKTMIELVYRCAEKSRASDIVVATDHQAIFDEVKDFGGKVCLTDDTHESGTDRLAEVVNTLNMKDDELVVNVQGDEPLIPAEVINQVAQNLNNNERCSAATLSEPIVSCEVLFNPNAVKVVCSQQGRALYFSRATIPWNRDQYTNQNSVTQQQISSADYPVQRHIGIYAYRVGLLRRFIHWPMSELEKIEKLEQLRILDNDHHIHVQPACKNVPAGVDTKEDLQRLRELIT